VKEFLELRRDRRMLPAMIVGPIIQLLALGYAANRDVTDVRLAVVDQDRSQASSALVDRFVASGRFRIEARAVTLSAVEPLLRDGSATMALVVAPGYAADAARGNPRRVQIVADGSDAANAVVALGYARQLVAQEAQPDAGSGALRLEPRVFYNPDLASRWFFVPAILALTLLLTTMILPSMAVVREKESGTLEQLIVTPVRPWQLVLGKLAPFVLVGLVDAAAVTGLAVWQFGVPLRGSFLLLMGLTLLFLLTTLGLGLLVSTVVQTQQQAMVTSVYLLMVPMIYLSGLIFPIENMPGALQAVSHFIPLRHYAVVIRGIFLKGSDATALWREAAMLAAFGMVTLSLAAARFRKRLD
jgi:ABC-2 type transport system permease protein